LLSMYRCLACSSHFLLSAVLSLFFSMLPLPPRSPLFPYTTLFRSGWDLLVSVGDLFYRDQEFYRAALKIEGQNSFQEYFHESMRSEEHTSELQSRFDLVCRLLLEKKKGSMKSVTKY